MVTKPRPKPPAQPTTHTRPAITSRDLAEHWRIDVPDDLLHTDAVRATIGLVADYAALHLTGHPERRLEVTPHADSHVHVWRVVSTPTQETP